jgi:predicted phosphodiesterase
VSGLLTRFGIIGDVHCEDERLATALEVVEGSRVEAILCVGDIVDGWGDVDKTVALLREHDVITVKGNHERWFLAGEMRNLDDSTKTVSTESADWLTALPSTREIETSRGKLLLCHGVGDDDMMVLRPDTRGYGLQHALDPIRDRSDLALIIGGHTHTRMVRALPSGPMFVNPGTLHRKWEAGFGLVDLETSRILFWDFGPYGVRASEEVDL